MFSTAEVGSPAQCLAEPHLGDGRSFGHGPRGWIRAATSFLGVLTVMLMAFQFKLINWRLDDPDIWWHLRNASYLIRNHHLPNQDTYSFTVAGHSWINHEWIAELVYYFSYSALGLAGLKLMTFLLVGTLFSCLLYLCYRRSRNFKASVAACLLVSFLSSVSYGPRTILVGYLYLVILVMVLERFRERGVAPLWLLPPLFCLWINTHGSWSLGLIVFFLTSVAGLMDGPWGQVTSTRWSPLQLRKLIWTAVASILALFINPYGWRLVWYPFDLALRQPLNIGHVAEWVSLDFHTFRGKLTLALLVALLLNQVFRNRRWQLGELLIFVFALYCGLTYVRFLVLLAIVSAPIFATMLDFLPRYRPAADLPKVNIAIILVILGLMVYYRPREAKVASSVAQSYPTGVLPYLKVHPLNGNLLNFFTWGGYLGWNDPSLRIFIDSRVDIFEYAGVLQDYLDLLTIKNPDSILQKYSIRYALLPVGEPFAYVLENDLRWKMLYKDNVCILLQTQEGFTHAPR